ncbi:hypothetical protein [Kitasatospora sp. NPDC086791]|uniref:hypothetical protein n=1 Tax=Kitasatospora sp. NPDC086791 TaxID=3155178 RepID=UPI0034244D5D
MSIADAAKAIAAKLRAEGHHLADDAHNLWDVLRGDETTLATEAAADVRQVTIDAGPVVAEIKTDAQAIGSEAVQDAEALAAEAAADVKGAAQPGAPSAQV